MAHLAAYMSSPCVVTEFHVVDWEDAIRRPYLIVLFVSLCLTGLAQAQQATVVGSLPFGASYVADGWLPVRVDVRNDSDSAIVGTVRIVPTVASAPEFRAPIHSPARSRVAQMVWAYFPGLKESRIALVTLNDSSGAQLARTELTGLPVPTDTAAMPNGIVEHGFLISIAGFQGDFSDEVTMENIGEMFAEFYQMRSTQVATDAAGVLSAWAPYRGAYAVQIRNMDPDDLAPSQREAILDYVRAGGVLLITAPDVAQVEGSWLEPLLPVRLIGNRLLNQSPALTGDAPVMFPRYLPCAEALEGSGKVVLRDGQFIHAAYREMGLGRIVFTSFPPGAIPAKDQDAAKFWHDLLGIARHPVGVAGTQFSAQYPELLEPMLGRDAASWMIAALAVVGLVMLVVVAHLIWTGTSRPVAFKITLTASMLIAVAFSAVAALRQNSEPLQEARLTIVDASDEGSLVSEFAAVSGSQQSIDRTVRDSTAVVGASLVRQDRPLIAEWPAALQRIEVYPQRVDLVSLAVQFRSSAKAAAAGRFGENGLELNLHNNMGIALTSGQLSWGAHRLSLPPMAMGESQAVVNSDNLRPHDEYASASGLTSQDEQHKGTILRAVMSAGSNARSQERWPTVYGWAREWPAVTSLGEVKPDRTGSQTLVRMPLKLERSSGTVRVDGVFNELYIGEARGIPYDLTHREFIRSSMPGEWPIAVQYPREIGLLTPTKARVTIDLSTGQHAVQIRVGQCPQGRKVVGKSNPEGKLVADWNGAVGSNSVEFACAPDDFDEQGRLWLYVSVKSTGAAGSMGVEPQWQFGRFIVDLEGQVAQ